MTWTAVGILGMSTCAVWELGLFTMLGVVTATTLALMLLTAFGIVGELIPLFLVVIFGVPLAGGVHPVQALASFFRFLHAWIPLRYLTDGTRALIFLNGANVGLTRAVLVLAATPWGHRDRGSTGPSDRTANCSGAPDPAGHPESRPPRPLRRGPTSNPSWRAIPCQGIVSACSDTR